MPLPQKLTSHLQTLHPSLFHSATTSPPFLTHARHGTLPKRILSHWLASDRLYIRHYVRFIGRLLALTPLEYATRGKEGGVERRVVGLLREALGGVEREVGFFERVAGEYGLELELELRTRDGEGEEGKEKEATREEVEEMGRVFGLVMVGLKGEDGDGDGDGNRGEAGEVEVEREKEERRMLMVGLTLLWGTELCYLTAWRNALPPSSPNQGQDRKSFRSDADGGALRTEFIPNWTSPEFAAFVSRIGGMVDEWWSEGLASGSESDEERERAEVLSRVEEAWRRLLRAEAGFWPMVE